MKSIRLILVAILLIVSSIANAQNAESLMKTFEHILDAYCEEYYDVDFPDRTYISESIAITIPSNLNDILNPSTGAYEITGTHSYRGATRHNYTKVKCKASIKQLKKNKYQIRFDKWYKTDLCALGHWEIGKTREYTFITLQPL